MGRIAYVNGAYVPHGQGVVHIEDRGFQLADGVYEVWALFDGRMSDEAGHFERLWRSLDELRIAHPMSEAALKIVLNETVRRNRIRDGLVYLQVTRGTSPRDHAFPNPEVPPTVVVTAKANDWSVADAKAAKGAKVITVPENRWGRCDIKTVGLLPNALAKQAARERGAIEAWFVDDMGLVTEGASSNAWIVDADGVLRTRDTNANILRGITRRSVMDLVRELGLPFAEKPFTPDEAKAAREAFVTGAGTLVMPIVAVDDKPIGDGAPGPVAMRLRHLYMQNARASAA